MHCLSRNRRVCRSIPKLTPGLTSPQNLACGLLELTPAADADAGNDDDDDDDDSEIRMPSGETAGMVAAKKAGRRLVEEVGAASDEAVQHEGVTEVRQRAPGRPEVVTISGARSAVASTGVEADSACDMSVVSSRRVTRDRAARPKRSNR